MLALPPYKLSTSPCNMKHTVRHVVQKLQGEIRKVEMWDGMGIEMFS